VPLVGRDMATEADFTVRRGERMPFVLAWHRSADPQPPPPYDAEQALAACAAVWREWSGHCTYEGHGAARSSGH
jgi:hypothetical protein